MARGRAASTYPTDIATLMAEASRARRDGRFARAEELCHRVLESAPDYPPSLNLLGLIKQSSGHHRQAARMFVKAIAVDEQNAACHYNLAASYQALDQRAAAATHFSKAIALGMSDKNVEDFILQNPDIAARVNRVAKAAPLAAPPITRQEIAAIARDIFLQCALQARLIRGVPLELFLTDLRSTLLEVASSGAAETVDNAVAELFCALAQQSFINEYVHTRGDQEVQASRLRDLLLQQAGGESVSVMLLAAVAAYFPLSFLAAAPSLLAAKWPNHAATLLRQQVREPLEEVKDRSGIPSLTPIDDPVSIAVMTQYEQNPYPRWTIRPLAARAGDAAQSDAGPDILIAGCGTGQHAFDVAERYPGGRILAVDMSLTSLAYARRKTREAKLHNVDYAQADILKLTTLGRSFDRIESVGVLHHLAEPNLGLCILLSLLKPDGILRVGLYSTAARHSIADARAIIAERGYSATPDGIRALRQFIIRNRHEPRWNLLLSTADDFYSMSGCRDLFFNVMEHTFTIPDIATLLEKHQLSFLGFELDDGILERFRSQYSAADALTDLDSWHDFETKNPQTFRHMYVFSVRRGQSPPPSYRRPPALESALSR